MTSILVRSEDRLEGTSNFNTWKERVLNILEEHDLDSFATTMVEEPTTNERRIKFNKNKANSKHLIFDLVKENIISMIIPLKTARECFDTHQFFQEEGLELRRGVHPKQGCVH